MCCYGNGIQFFLQRSNNCFHWERKSITVLWQVGLVPIQEEHFICKYPLWRCYGKSLPSATQITSQFKNNSPFFDDMSIFFIFINTEKSCRKSMQIIIKGYLLMQEAVMAFLKFLWSRIGNNKLRLCKLLLEVIGCHDNDYCHIWFLVFLSTRLCVNLQIMRLLYKWTKWIPVTW